MRLLLSLLTIFVIGASIVVAQVPYSSQLRTDPAVGNIQGIQRYGRPLRTDPDQGSGFTFHVFPTTFSSAVMGWSSPVPIDADGLHKSHQEVGGRDAAPSNTGQSSQHRQLRPSGLGRIALVAGQDREHAAAEHSIQQAGGPIGPLTVPGSAPQVEEGVPPGPIVTQDHQDAEEGRPPGDIVTRDRQDGGEVSSTANDSAENIARRASETTNPPRDLFDPAYLSPPPFDWTSGLRNLGPPAVPVPTDPLFGTQSTVVSRQGLTTTGYEQVYQQPLIQIKMRIVEVNRGDSLTVGSILEYVSRADGIASLTSGQTANDGNQNFRSISRFLGQNLATSATSTNTGSGALINLTSEHINWLVQGLSTELNADVITAPEVVTLNGQNVEFVSGEKLPFQLGQNVIQGTNNNIQQVFYKHVGTMVSVTPRIVNWALHGEGRGERSIQANNVLHWSHLIKAMHYMELGLQHLDRVNVAPRDLASLNQGVVPSALAIGTLDSQIALAPGVKVTTLELDTRWYLQSNDESYLLSHRPKHDRTDPQQKVELDVFGVDGFSGNVQPSDLTELNNSRFSTTVETLLATHDVKIDSAEITTITPGRSWKLKAGRETYLLEGRGDQLVAFREHPFVKPDGTTISGLLSQFRHEEFIPFSVQAEVLLALNNYSKGKLEQMLPQLVEQEIIAEECLANCRTWKPSDCTIDLAVVVRLSEGVPTSIGHPDEATLGRITAESNIRAVANVIQVRSGHGVVMAGLMGERESEEVAKTPILGDLPLVGTLFRTKITGREKTEVLVFIEAIVLDPEPIVARADSARDFLLGQAYVQGGVLDNPLELGMYRVGFGGYLPPGTIHERLYWEKFHRTIRKSWTHLGDILEP